MIRKVERLYWTKNDSSVFHLVGNQISRFQANLFAYFLRYRDLSFGRYPTRMVSHIYFFTIVLRIYQACPNRQQSGRCRGAG